MAISSGSVGSEEDLKLIIDQKKQKRMLSNRESAKRSRSRKQKHFDDLTAHVSQLRNENNQILTSLNIITQHYLNLESENSVLKAQIGELNHRLQSLNEITNYLNASNIEFETDSFKNPWDSLFLNNSLLLL